MTDLPSRHTIRADMEALHDHLNAARKIAEKYGNAETEPRWAKWFISVQMIQLAFVQKLVTYRIARNLNR